MKDRKLARIRAQNAAMETTPMAGDPEAYRQRIDRIADAILAHKPKARTPKAKRRARRSRNIQRRESCI
jgi:hypothetical protein